MKDLTGQRFNKLVVIEKDIEKSKGKWNYWKCECDCGKQLSVRVDKLKGGQKSCGCHTRPFDLDSLVGQTFGYLTVIKRDTNKDKGHQKSAYWICKCKCSNEVSVNASSLRNNITKSCGCLKSECPLKRIPYDKLNILSLDLLMED